MNRTNVERDFDVEIIEREHNASDGAITEIETIESNLQEPSSNLMPTSSVKAVDLEVDQDAVLERTVRYYPHFDTDNPKTYTATGRITTKDYVFEEDIHFKARAVTAVQDNQVKKSKLNQTVTKHHFSEVGAVPNGKNNSEKAINNLYEVTDTKTGNKWWIPGNNLTKEELKKLSTLPVDDDATTITIKPLKLKRFTVDSIEKTIDVSNINKLEKVGFNYEIKDYSKSSAFDFKVNHFE